MFAEKGGTTTNLEGRVTTVAQRVTAGRNVAGRLDGRRRARRPARLRRAGADAVDGRTSITDAIAEHGARLRRGDSLGAGRQRRRRARRQRRPTAGSAALDGTPAGDRNSYDYRVVLARRLYDRATMTAKSPSLAGLAGDGDAHVNPADADKISAPEDGTVRLIGARGSVAHRRCARTPPCRGAPCSSRSTAASEINSIIDATAGAPTSRIEVDEPVSELAGDFDPLLVGELKWTPLVIVAVEDPRHLRRRPRRHDVHGLVRAQGHRRDAEPHRTEQGRAVRHPADARRRDEADLQGGLPPRSRRSLRVPPGAVPRLRAGVPRLVGDPARRRLQRRQRRHRRLVRTRHEGAARRSAGRHPVRPGPVVDRRLRDHARRLVERVEVPVARLGAGVGADGQLRGRPRAQRRQRRARRRHVDDVGHRRRPGHVRRAGT